MTPRDIVREQIRHHETPTVPYTLPFEEDVGLRLDQHFGGNAWRAKLVPYLTYCGGVSKFPSETLDATHYRDAFGTIWRTDELPHAVVEPGLKEPNFDGYVFPSVDTLRDPVAKADAIKKVRETPDAFSFISPGVCLWQSWYLRGFETTLMDCAAEEDFYAELLERMTELTLALVAE